MSDSGPITQHRAERVLAFMFVGIVGISILAFIAVMIGTLTGAGANDGFSQGVWPIVLTLPLFGLPIAFILLIALIIVNGVRRAARLAGRVELTAADARARRTTPRAAATRTRDGARTRASSMRPECATSSTSPRCSSRPTPSTT